MHSGPRSHCTASEPPHVLSARYSIWQRMSSGRRVQYCWMHAGLTSTMTFEQSGGVDGRGRSGGRWMPPPALLALPSPALLALPLPAEAPLLAVLKIICDQFEPLRPWGIVLGGGHSPAAAGNHVSTA